MRNIRVLLAASAMLAAVSAAAVACPVDKHGEKAEGETASAPAVV